MSIREQEIRVDYAVEAPLAVLAAHPMPDGADFDDVILSEIRHGLILTLDGATIPTESLPVDPAAFPPADGGASRVYRVSLTASTNLTGVHDISISNGNFPDSASFFASAGMVTGDLEVISASVVDARKGRLIDRSQRYELGDRHRTLTVHVQRRTDPLASLFHAATSAPDRVQGLFDAHVRPVENQLSDGRSSPETMLAWWASAFLAGLGGGAQSAQANRVHLRLTALAGILAWGSIQFGQPGVSALVASIGALFCLIGLWRPTSTGIAASGITVLGVTALTPHLGVVLGIAASWLAGALPARIWLVDRPRARWLGALVLIAAILATLPHLPG